MQITTSDYRNLLRLNGLSRVLFVFLCFMLQYDLAKKYFMISHRDAWRSVTGSVLGEGEARRSL